jgi:hypothetical protein
MADEDPMSDQAPPQPTTTNLAPSEAAELMSATVLNLRQQWLQSAVTVANILRGGQTVNRGTFEDLKRLRENYEELERARIVLLKLLPTDDAKADTTKPN